MVQETEISAVEGSGFLNFKFSFVPQYSPPAILPLDRGTQVKT